MRVYLDVSCLNRPFDAQEQVRVRLETEAVHVIMEKIETGQISHVCSDMVAIEIDAHPDPQRRRRLREMLPAGDDIIPLSDSILQRAVECQMMGFKPADAAHVAAAEALRADVLLSCDDRMCKAADRSRAKLRVRVMNPLAWLAEVEHGTNP